MSLLDKRSNGVLMHISSLPGETGIGTMGKHAFAFVDFLVKSGQTYWQILPICPTSYGDSPYQSFSTFAGNPYFIDFELLEKDGLISAQDYKNVKWCESEKKVDYGILYVERHKIFKLIQKNFEKNIPADYHEFCKKNDFWLQDYALFMAIKDEHNGSSFINWEKDILLHESSAVEKWTKKCSDRIEYYKILQYLFFKQWFSLKDYANKKGISIIGDIPIYVAADSADVWTNPEIFMLDENHIPIEVAGCPPDAYALGGQLWGNPVYRWDYCKKTGFKWWKQRITSSLKIYDILRIDHFRGFDTFYSVKYGSIDAKIGEWKKGPGMDLFKELKDSFGELPIIAEDLGYVTDTVRQLLKDTGFPGMKVLQFAFDANDKNGYIPYEFPKNCVVYTGTHDNCTINQWVEQEKEQFVQAAMDYYRITDKSKVREEMMLSGISSVANTCILTMQDLIGCGKEGRMNTPSTVGENWKWRATSDQFSDDIVEFLGKYTKIYGRKNEKICQ
ncbi:4-alpha-glucanotransferase [Treponema sp. Marseille-Q3903]|uniref:4-alpha-glucanotransferase n=1 Tax=Treponema sp. Marseille-Q3903 TaxID=2766703 RepID=UPI0016520CE7|nr:4-alpha-glucanotransferase [Treponema sp. Marseille-Q3903]MBC6713852.1 4-alpha-glucanotransferase [Treponema sp. Marseille-Q3903]